MPTALPKNTLQLGERPAVLVVDAMIAFTDPTHVLGAEVTSEIANINSLLDFAREREWPCYFSAVWYESDVEAKVFRRKVPALNCLIPEAPEIAIDPRLQQTGEDIVFRKTHASCFHGTELDNWLSARGVDSVLVCGFTTSGCVRATAVDALQCDYATFVIQDAVADRDPDAHRANLYDLGAKYVEVLSLAELSNLLTRSA